MSNSRERCCPKYLMQRVRIQPRVWNSRTFSFSERTLGVQWDLEKHRPPTKRRILSVVSLLYDPMRSLFPVVLKVKKIMQKMMKYQKICRATRTSASVSWLPYHNFK